MSDTTIETIRDLREKKRLGQYTVSQACGIGFSAYVRIEAGTGKTTPEEVASVLETLRAMPDGNRKLGGGRPFNDPNKRAAVQAAREKGESVAEALARLAGAAAQPEPAAAPQVVSEEAQDTVAADARAHVMAAVAQVQEQHASEEEEETPKQRDARKARERRAARKAAEEAAAAESGLL